MKMGSLKHRTATRAKQLFCNARGTPRHFPRWRQLKINFRVQPHRARSRLDPDQKRAIEATTLLMEAEAGSLLLVDEATGELYVEVAHGEKSAAVREIRLKAGKEIAGYVANRRKPVIVIAGHRQTTSRRIAADQSRERRRGDNT